MTVAGIVRAVREVSAVESADQQRARLQCELAQVESGGGELRRGHCSGRRYARHRAHGVRLRERRRDDLRAALARLEHQVLDDPPLDLAALRPPIARFLADWRGLAAKHVAATRQLHWKLLVTGSPSAPTRIRGWA